MKTETELRLRLIEILEREAKMNAELFQVWQLYEMNPTAVGAALYNIKKKILTEYRRQIFPEIVKIVQQLDGERIPDEFFKWLKNPNEPASS